MRIGIFTQSYMPDVSGLGTVAYILAREFQSLGHETLVFTGTKNPEKMNNEGLYSLHWPHQHYNEMNSCDVFLYIHYRTTALLAALLHPQIPSVMSLHGYMLSSRLKVLIVLMRILIHNSYICVSNIGADSVPFDKTVVYNPYDSKIFLDNTSNWLKRKYDIGFFGRLCESKSFDFFMDLIIQIAEKRKINVIVAGEGPLSDIITKLSLPKPVLQNLHLDFRGRLGMNETAAMMKDSKVVLVPSRYSEPLGLTAIEAVSAGCYVITSGRGGLSEIGPGVVDTILELVPTFWETKILQALRSRQTPYSEVEKKSVLDRFSPKEAAIKYLRVLEEASS